jgi:endoglucanase
LLIAWALTRAAKLWREPALATRAAQIVEDLAAKAVITDPAYGTLLLPAASGFSASDQADGPVINLSYWVFPAIEELSVISPKFPSQALIETGVKLLTTARFGTNQLPSDWVSLKENYPRPAEKFAPNFGYDAVRIPLYAAWIGPETSKLSSRIYQRWNKDSRDTVQVIELATGTPLVAMQDPGYQAVSELLTCSLGKPVNSQAITAFQPTEYYPSTLHLMSIIAISERYPQCLQNLN